MLKQYRKNFFILSVNSLIAQAVSILFIIAITKIYGPEKFSVIVLYSNLLLWVGPIVCLKYDVAIVVAKTAAVSANLVALSILISSIIAILAFTLVILNSFFNLLDGFLQNLIIWAVLAPVGILITGASMALRSFLHYHKEYLNFSSTPIIFSVVNGVLSTSLYFVWPSGTTLVASQILATLFICIFILKKLKSKNYLGEKVTLKEMLSIGYKNIHYPVFSAPGSLLAGMSQAMPVYFIALVYNSVVVASYGLMLKIVLAPITFIFSSISTLMLKVIHDEINGGRPAIVFWKVSFVLFVFILATSLILITWSASIISLILGDEWIYIGRIIETMCFALLFGAAVSSLSNIFAATNHLGLGALWQVIYFLVSISFFAVVYLSFDFDREVFFILLAAKEIGLYLIYFLMIAYSVHKPNNG